MKVRTEKKEDSIVRMDVTIPWEDLSDEFDSTIQMISRNIKEPGFRKGKMPVSMIRNKYKSDIEAEFIDNVIRKQYLDFISEANIEPIDSGNLVDMNFKEGEDLSLTIEVQIEPEFKLYDYGKNNLEVLKHIVEIGDDDVKRAIEEVREQYAEVKNTAKGAEIGNYLEVDIQELDESLTPIIGKRVEKRVLKLGEGEFGEKAAEQLLGSVPGDERVVRVVQEHGDHSHNFTFRFSINSVEEHILPDVDADFAKKVNDSFKSVEELKEKIRKDLQARYDAESRNLVNNALADEMVRVTDIEVPETMIKSYLDGIISRAKENANEDVDEDYIRENYRTGAIWNMKWLMIRKSVYRKEGFEVNDSDIDDWMEKSAQLLGLDKTAVLSMKNDNDQREKIRQDIFESKVMEALRSNAKYNEKKMSAAEFNLMLNANHHH